MTIEAVLANVRYINPDPGDQIIIDSTLTMIYSANPEGRLLLEASANRDVLLYFINNLNGGNKGGLGTNTVKYDWDQLDNFLEISKTGTVFEPSIARVIGHELFHAVYAADDPEPANLTTVGAEYYGEAVDKENTLAGQLGDSNVRASYLAAIYRADLASIGASVGMSLTEGNQIGLAVVDPNTIKFNAIDVTDRTDRVLLIGLDGDDIINSGSGNDYLYGGEGIDVLSGSFGADKLYGNAGGDVFIGGLIFPGFTAASANDISTYHAEWNDGARDMFYGGAGNDTMLMASTSVTSEWIHKRQDGSINMSSDVYGLLKNLDIIDGSDTDYTLNAQGKGPTTSAFGYFSTTSNVIASALAAGPSFDGFGYSLASVSGAGNSGSRGAFGMKVDDAQFGSVMMIVADIGDYQMVIGGVTIASRDASAPGGSWTVFGTPSASAAAAFTNEVALTAIGDDILLAGNAQENIYGLSGNDTITAGVYGAGIDYFDGGSGTDIVNYTGASSNLIIKLYDPTLGEGNATGSGISTDFIVSIENVTGGTGNDDITGSDGANSLDGGVGTDTIHGGLGMDVLIGGSGIDRLYGEAGSDTYFVDNTSDVVSENAGEGTDIVNSMASYTLSANIEKLVLQGSALNGAGNDLANTITGNGQNNLLDGGTGGDTLIGGLGNDTYVADNMSDVLQETSGQGTDLVQSSVTFTLTSDFEDLTLTGTTAINGSGNALANTINGNNGVNTLAGGNGNDILYGRNGADSMTGGMGEDTLTGGMGADILTGGSGDVKDTFIFIAGGDNDIITDFQSGTGLDVIDLTAITAITDIADLKSATHLSFSTGDAIISWGGSGDQIKLTGITAAGQLYGNDFLFA